MAQTCKTCSHPQLAEIDRAILAGEPKRRIAARCDVSETALRRHAAHVSETVALAVKAEEETRADDLLGLLHEAVRDARRLRAKAEEADDVRGAIAAVRVLCDVVERLASVGERLATSAAAKPGEPTTIVVTFGDEPDAYPSSGERLVTDPPVPAAKDREAAPAPRAPEPDPPPPRRPAPPPPAAPAPPPAELPEEPWKRGGFYGGAATGQRLI